MARHIIRRFLQAIPTLFGITILSYFLMAIAPGNPVARMSFDNPDMTQTERDRIAARYGLLEPWYMQYITWLSGNDWHWWAGDYYTDDGEFIAQRTLRYGIIRGDFGNSLVKKLPVNQLLVPRIRASIELGLSTFLVAIILGIPIGIGAAVWRGGKFDNFTRILAVVGNAIPNFWFGLLLILIFGVSMDLSWARGDRCDKRVYRRIACDDVPLYNRVAYLIMPTIVAAYGGVAGYSRFMRTSMLDTINSDYIRTARAKGLPARDVWFKHGARNALIPIATFLGPTLVFIWSNSVVVERIFNWPGLGLLLLQAVGERDYPVIMASVTVSGFLTVIGYVISDLLYAVFDPRIRF
jgi:peptide/nickel transport system permease protein